MWGKGCRKTLRSCCLDQGLSGFLKQQMSDCSLAMCHNFADRADLTSMFASFASPSTPIYAVQPDCTSCALVQMMLVTTAGQKESAGGLMHFSQLKQSCCDLDQDPLCEPCSYLMVRNTLCCCVLILLHQVQHFCRA